VRLASALACAHAHRLLHRDVKPANVMVSRAGDVKLLDFGIAQALMKFTSEIGILKGKFSYMSPEQIRGMPLDARTDVFSAGIILHEMLTTEKLFRGDTEFALMEKVRKAEVPPPSNFNRRVTPELDAIALRALARDVADRYQNAQQLAADLDALIAGYRFDPKELRQFMRQLFRKEYAKEMEDSEIALESEPGLSMSMSQPRAPSVPGIPVGRASGPEPSGLRPSGPEPRATIQGIGRPGSNPTTGPLPSQPEPNPEDPDDGDPEKPKGFWGSLFRKRK
jgi:serine/threonine protein kinase